MFSPIDKVPTEIFMEIFKAACTDDGATGRSLSLVSHFVNEASKGVKLQSLAIVGLRQIMTAAVMLENTPPEFRRVKHLFLSGGPQHEDPNDRQEFLRDRTNNAGASGAAHFDGACKAFCRILEFTAPTLLSFYLASEVSRNCTLLPVSMPALVELTVHCPFPSTPWDYYGEGSDFHSLRRLRIIGPNDYNEKVFQDISEQAPYLTHLAFIPKCPSRVLHLDLEIALGIPRRRNRRHLFPTFVYAKRVTLPSTLTHVYVQPGVNVPGVNTHSSFEDSARIMINGIKAVAKLDKRVILLKPGTTLLNEDRAKVDWLYGRPVDFDAN
ncbi:hypothetical protein BD779DRAFT_1670396 [Infundibulicybe gibba]|nr:hypothetical protein BD779DRAFT_1670396 [Infundibulicybe gibba]